jgi:virginiamycin A acetyltransferase
MVQYCYDDKILKLFKRALRKLYYKYPEVVASQVESYRMMYEDDEDYDDNEYESNEENEQRNTMIIKRIGPDPNAAFPNPEMPGMCFIKNVITRKNIEVGEYSYYYDDTHNPAEFETRNITHHYENLGDKLIIGKFCAFGKNIEFVMNGANHRMNSATTYPFNIFGSGWEKVTPDVSELPFKGDTVIGNDVWIGADVTILPGIHIGDGAIVAANSVVTKSVPPYTIVGGNPIKVIRKRFDDEIIEFLQNLKWWDWSAEKIFENLELLCGADIGRLSSIIG